MHNVLYGILIFVYIHTSERLTLLKRTFKALVNLGWWPLWHLSH